jgi:hypothetical protein
MVHTFCSWRQKENIEHLATDYQQRDQNKNASYTLLEIAQDISFNHENEEMLSLFSR